MHLMVTCQIAQLRKYSAAYITIERFLFCVGPQVLVKLLLALKDFCTRAVVAKEDLADLATILVLAADHYNEVT